MEFVRERRRIGHLNLTPLIDVLFILIIFFMLTTSFMKLESLELVLPSAAGGAAKNNEVVHLFVYPNGDMVLGQRKLTTEELTASLSRMFGKDESTPVMLLTAEGVTVQQMVGVMDRVYMAGGKSLMVRPWKNPPKAGQGE